MLKLTRKVGIAVSLVASAAAVVALASPANADTAARQGDVVGVGSDTFQNGADFVFDGAPGVAGGYNNVGNNHRVVNVFATGDANGRATYDGNCGPADSTGLGQFCGATTNLTPNLLAGTVILRAGTKPVTRPNGSGAGVGALINDSGAGYQSLPTGSIQFARMSRLPNSTEEGLCPTTNAACAGLHVYQEATDSLTIVHQASAYNGPAGLSAAELYHIYVDCTITTWNQLGMTSTNTIHPLIPQSGSGTRTFFLTDLNASQGLTGAATPGACTRVVEEHDPSGIYQDASAADAIEPFSVGKLNLINGNVPTAIANGYFSNPGYNGGATLPQGAYTPNYLATLTGTAPDNSASYSSSRGLFITIRQADVTSTNGFQSGTTGTSQNYSSQLFTTAITSAMRSASGQAELREAGFTPSFIDCGINPGATCP